MASSASNIPSGVGGRAYYGAMGGPSGRRRSGLPFGYETIGRHPGNLYWPHDPTVWCGCFTLEEGALNITRLERCQKIETGAERQLLKAHEIEYELNQIERVAEADQMLARGHLAVVRKAIEKSLGAGNLASRFRALCERLA